MDFSLKIASLFSLADQRMRFWKSIPPDGVLLDVGCATGRVARRIAELRPDLKIVGVDVKDFSAEFGETSIQFVEADVTKERLPFEDNSFDAVQMIHLLEHLESFEILCSELKRILKTDGKIYAEVPGLRSLFVPSFRFAAEQRSPANFFDDPTHVRPFSKGRLYYLFLDKGFAPVRFGTYHNYLFMFLSPLLILWGLAVHKREWLLRGLWHLVGWSVFLVAEVNHSTATLGHAEESK
jgi:ubiquinone/menaquinone biosynthesis C-methylase UbiE